MREIADLLLELSAVIYTWFSNLTIRMHVYCEGLVTQTKDTGLVISDAEYFS